MTQKVKVKDGKIGIAAENRPGEKRIIILPHEARRLTMHHDVMVEEAAGRGLGIADAEYKKVGCKIGTREQVYSRNLVIRIKEPTIREIKLMRPGSVLMSMMHIRCHPELETALRKQKIITIPLENLKDPFGNRKVEAVLDSGRIGMEYGFKLWKKDPAKAQVRIMGYGNMAMGAIRCAARKFAKVEILNKKHFQEMEKHLPGTDILVDAVNRPFRREVKKEPPFVTRKMLKLLKKGSVIVDLVSNPKNHAPVETMRPTSVTDPYYILDGIYHTSLWGWPAMEPAPVAKRYSIQVTPIIREIINKGIDHVPAFIKNATLRFDET